MIHVQYHLAYSGSPAKSIDDDSNDFRFFGVMARQDKSTKKFLVFLALFCLPLHACAFSGKALEGKVLEEGTGMPIVGAIVVARWQGHLATFAHGKTVCYHALSSTSDESGGYRFAPWKRKITEDWQKNVQPETVIVTAYKSGYQLARRYPANSPLLERLTGAREERLKAIRMAGVSCDSAGESWKNLLPLYRTLYEEARGLAVTKADKAVVNNLLYKIDLIELPYEEAEKRNAERNNALNRE